MASVYEIVTEKIIEKMDKGIIPWHQPWHGASQIDGVFGFYRNGVSKRKYTGMNILMLAGCGYDSPDFFTFKQISDAGAHIRKGEKSEMVVFWKRSQYLSKPEEGDDDSEAELKTGLLMRYYNVWNREQIEGLKPPKDVQNADSTTPEAPKILPIDMAEKVVQGYQDGPTIAEGVQRAYYSPVIDHVNMPERQSFISAEAWYSTLFHELTHSTGHDKRLNRKDMKIYRNEFRAREELVAEIGAAFLCEHCGIGAPVIENTVAYIQSWKKHLKDDPRIIATAAQQAQKAANWILGNRNQNKED